MRWIPVHGIDGVDGDDRGAGMMAPVAKQSAKRGAARRVALVLVSRTEIASSRTARQSTAIDLGTGPLRLGGGPPPCAGGGQVSLHLRQTLIR